jgi:hypothetical protein
VTGFLPGLLLIAGAIGAALRRDEGLLWAGAASLVSWFMTSAGTGVGDLQLREAMVQSEETFLWLCSRGAITRVERSDGDAAPVLPAS